MEPSVRDEASASPATRRDTARPRQMRKTAAKRALQAAQAPVEPAGPRRAAGGTQSVPGAARPAGTAGRDREPWHYAKHVAAYLHPDADQRVARRHVRYAQREIAWRWSTLERVRKCGRVAVQDGDAMAKCADGVAHYAGLATCGSIWACPVCSAKIRNFRAEEISRAAAEWDRRGNCVYMVALTMPHDYGDRLAATFDTVAKSWRKLLQTRRWRELRERHGIVGYIRTVEVTHGANGWHPHIHALLFIEGGMTALALYEISTYLRDRWAQQIVRAGYRIPNDHGVRIDHCTAAAEAGAYIAKTQDGKGVGNELARADLKQGRSGSRTPFEILDDFRWTGDADDLARWHEYEQATHRRQAITWSKGLRDLLQAGAERSDEEIAEAEVGGEDVARIPRETWKKIIRRPGLQAALLDAVERGGLEAANELLADHGIEALLPPPDPSDTAPQ